MRLSVPAGIGVVLATLFSLYHLVLALTSLPVVFAPQPVIACMVLYAAATAGSLLPGKALLPVWASCFALATSIVMPIVIAPEVPSSAPEAGYATWYIAAVGTLMTILAVRQRFVFAWAGTAFLLVHTIFWHGIGSIFGLGVVGCVFWVAAGTTFSYVVNRATRTTREFVQAEQETADWQAAQDAHVYERQFRLEQTTRMARPMLERIIASHGELTPEERAESLNLEGAIRDEIRGRTLLSDAVRDEVMGLRRRGATVQLLDEGGLDDVDDDERDRIHAELAAALQRASDADNVIVRTVPPGSDIAVTVVGLRLDGAASESAALGADLGDDGDDDDDDSVALWLEIPRHR